MGFFDNIVSSIRNNNTVNRSQDYNEADIAFLRDQQMRDTRKSFAQAQEAQALGMDQGIPLGAQPTNNAQGFTGAMPTHSGIGTPLNNVGRLDNSPPPAPPNFNAYKQALNDFPKVNPVGSLEQSINSYKQGKKSTLANASTMKELYDAFDWGRVKDFMNYRVGADR